MHPSGQLDRQSVGSVLRAAAEERLNGKLELHGDVDVTITLSSGYVADATIFGHRSVSEENPAKETLRLHLVSIFSRVLGMTTGSYQFHPVKPHSTEVRWMFQMDGLLRAAEARKDQDRPLERWLDHDVVVCPTDAKVRVDADAWNLVAAMVRPTVTLELRNQLDWDPRRLAAALAQLESLGLIRPPAGEEAPAQPATTEAAPTGSPVDGSPIAAPSLPARSGT